jgi:hypothetical protein
MAERDTSLDHRTLDWAVEIIGMCEPIRCVQGGMWFGRNHNFADATFVDYGAADAFAVAAKTFPALVKALEQISNHTFGDGTLTKAAKIARDALAPVGSETEHGK